MPFVEVKSIEGVFSAEEKAEVIAEITNVFSRIKNAEFAKGTWVVVNELANGDWGEGGLVLKADDVPDSSTAA
jgi:4-oxalocrotonate tautomerase